MNETIFYFFYNLAHQSTFFDQIVTFIAEPFGDIVIVSAVTFLLFHHEIFGKKHPTAELKRKWKEIILVFFTALVARGITEVLKYSIQAERPFVKLQGVQSLFLETDPAFPSGHATFFMGLAVAIYLTHKKTGYIFIFFALLIGLARVIAGVHFPIDILVGFILGILVPILVNNFTKKKM
ncbi:MAG: hypothetical protein QG583_146 [Patescibacteria group bacterium]|nr:hypothetical protein [Patescibacteria group bacterium]